MSRRLDPDALHLLPLGGTGEIGMNLNLYHHAGRWLMVDCGVSFERVDAHEMHVVYPDPSFAVSVRRKLEGLVLTHAHQDHVGAVADVWPDLRCRVYATRFTAELLKEALRERGLLREVPLTIVAEDAALRLGPFELRRIPLTHSIPEMGALRIRTPAGTVLHTGDFKLDPDPVVGRRTDEAALRALGDGSLDAVICDSTNADHEGWTGSEASVVDPLTAVIGGCRERVAVTLFASNVARLQTLFRVAERLGRHVVLLGRSLHKTARAARAAGYLQDLPEPVDPREFGWLPRDRVLLICTGAQGEPRAALSKLAEDRRDDVYLEAGDALLFSARLIPGNELWVERITRTLHARGVRIVTADDAPIHVSGHPRRDELRQLYAWTRPRLVVPVHGTPPKLEAHAALAEELGLEAARIRNGQALRLAPGPPRIARTVRTGRLRRVEEAPPRR